MNLSLEPGNIAVVEMFLQDGGLGEEFGVEAELAAFFDIGGDVVGVETLRRVAMDRFDGRFVDLGFRLDGADFA